MSERHAGACGFGVDEGYCEVVLDSGSGLEDVIDGRPGVKSIDWGQRVSGE